MIKIQHSFDSFLKGMSKFQKDIAYIQATATNNLAFDIQKAVKSEISGKLKINNQKLPTLRVQKATKEKLFARVFHDGWQEEALAHHFKGGDRERKGMEKAMIHFKFMSKDEILTPSPGVKIKSWVYTQMMSQLQLNYKAGYAANETKRSRKRKAKRRTSAARFFMVSSFSRSHLHPGIYARMPGHRGLICMLRIVKNPSYKKRMDLDLTASKVIKRRAKVHYEKALQRAAHNRLNKVGKFAAGMMK